MLKNLLSAPRTALSDISVRCPDKFYPLQWHNMKLTLMDVYNCVCGQGGKEIKLDEI